MKNKNLNTTAIFAGEQAWQTELSFLKNYGLDQLCLTILALAKSKNGIQSLHNLLPKNFQLLKSDLTKLENFWEKYIKPDLSTNNQADRSLLTTEWLLKTPCVSLRKSTQYYLDYLRSKSAQPYASVENSLIYSIHSPTNLLVINQPRGGHGYAHFWTMINQAKLELECLVDAAYQKPGQRIFVRLVTVQNQLTAEMTSQLAKLPSYIMKGYKADNENGSEVGFEYYLSNDGLTDFLSPPEPPKTYLIARPGFLDLLQARLSAIGIVFDPGTKIESLEKTFFEWSPQIQF